MTDRSSDEDLASLVAELVRSLEELEAEVDPPERRVRPPTPGELRRFTSEVAIPGLILVLETNIRALRLLQRALELREGAERTRDGVSDVRERAEAASATTLERLDGVLADLQTAVEGRPGDGEAAEILAEARELRDEVQSRLDEYAQGGDETPRRHETADASADESADESADASADESADAANGDSQEDVAVDVDAELASIREELDEPTADEPDESDGSAADTAGEATDDGGDGPETDP